MITAAVITGYVVVGVLVSLGVEVYLRATLEKRGYMGIGPNDHDIAAASGVFWPLAGAVWLIYQGVRGIGRLAQAIADRIPTWSERITELREEWNR